MYDISLKVGKVLPSDQDHNKGLAVAKNLTLATSDLFSVK